MTAYKFPENFIWGAATASYQIEGAVFEDGRKSSIWDTFSHTKGNVFNGDTGDTACDHYHIYKDDIKLIKELGLKAYRFSIAWSRIFPDGYGEPNEKGMQFYMDLVEELIKNNIEPCVTLYHWDLPQALQDIGGFENRDIVKHFKNYASYIFDKLGDKIKYWITFNEPWVSTILGNYEGIHAPGIKNIETALKVGHNLLLAHGEAVRVFREKKLNGKIGITYNVTPKYPLTQSLEDIEAAERAHSYEFRWFINPVLKQTYPDNLVKWYEGNNIKLPEIQPDDMKIISTPVDFIGINYYFRQVIKHGSSMPGIEVVRQPGKYTEMDWEIYPEGLYDILMRIKKDYGNIDIYITENGAAFKDTLDTDRRIRDNERIEYFVEHFKSAYKAIQDGVQLKGYFAWSLLDNFEWQLGYSKRFGIIYVDYKTQERIIKDSGYWYKNVIENNSLNDN